MASSNSGEGPDKEDAELQEPSREEPAEPKDKRPPYLRDEPPTGKSNIIKWSLLHGKTEDELKAEGFNTRTVDICAQELEKAGHRTRPKRDKGGSSKDLVPSTSKGIQIHAKGSSPEALIDSLTIPLEDGEGPSFEKGMKFGMTVLTLGVRVAQELSNMGVQQARPLVEMARDMRQGEAAAAKNAAGEAAVMAAGLVEQQMNPILLRLAEQGARDTGVDPMKAMLVRTMEPMMKKLMGSLIPGVDQGPPEGWSKRRE